MIIRLQNLNIKKKGKTGNISRRQKRERDNQQASISCCRKAWIRYGSGSGNNEQYTNSDTQGYKAKVEFESLLELALKGAKSEEILSKIRR